MSNEESFAMDFDENSKAGFVRSEKTSLDPPVIEVYLAGPMTNNDLELQAHCDRVREIVKRLLHAYDYLGLRFQVYDPADVTQPGSSHTDEEVYVMDHDRTMSADLVIFHVNAPSLGVGSESQIAADATVPRVTISKTGVPVSRMFRGIFSPSIVDISYADCADLELQLSRSISRIARVTVESAIRRRPLMTDYRAANIGRQIFAQRIVHSLPIERLARLTDIKENWLRRLEREPVIAMCASSIQLVRIAEAIKCYVVITNQIPTLKPQDRDFLDDEKQSLSNLMDCVLENKTWVKDNEIFRVWGQYRESLKRERAEAVAHRGGENKAITVDQWKRLLYPDSLYE